MAQNPLFIPPKIEGDEFDLKIKAAQHVFKTGILTQTFGFNGSYLGPTLVVEKGHDVMFMVENQLDEETSVHWHGLHAPPLFDGGPTHFNHIHAGETWMPFFKITNRASTCWYHPHLHGSTEKHVVLGAAGMIIVRDADEAALPLPRTYGVDDIPLIIQDKTFDSTGQIVVTGLSHEMMVNGVLDAHFDAPAQWLRFRALNASASRVYFLGFSDSTDLVQIGGDGGLLEHPLPLKRLQIAPGERLEFLVDFSNRLPGNTLALMSFSPEMLEGVPGQGPVIAPGLPGETSLLNGAVFPILKIKIALPTANPVLTAPPATLASHPEKPLESQSTKTRKITLMSPNNGAGGPFYFDGVPFDENVVNQIVPFGATEIWEIKNQTLIGHPFHIHGVSFFILKKDLLPPVPSEAGPKDVVFVNRGKTVRFIARFDHHADNTTPYMYHCHMLFHEDSGTMGSFLVVDSTFVDAPEVSDGQLGSAVLVSPNPSAGVFQFKIDLPGGGDLRLEVFSADGKLVWENSETTSGTFQKTIDLRGQNPGVFWLRATVGGKVFYKKLVKN